MLGVNKVTCLDCYPNPKIKLKVGKWSQNLGKTVHISAYILESKSKFDS